MFKDCLFGEQANGYFSAPYEEISVNEHGICNWMTVDEHSRASQFHIWIGSSSLLLLVRYLNLKYSLGRNSTDT